MKTPISLLVFALSAISGAIPVDLVIRAQNQQFTSSQADPRNGNDGIGRGKDAYKLYQGNGANWPKISEWVSFQQMFDANAAIMKKGCSNQQLPVTDTTDEEIGSIYWAIQNVARVTRVDHRFILAILMQESKGCVRVHTTRVDHANPGLMQSNQGSFSCHPATKGVTGQAKLPCTYQDIYGMILDGTGGTGGTAAGDGLAGCLNKAIAGASAKGIPNVNGGNSQVFYQAARMYNSGSVNYDDLNDKFSSTICYASDIANRLTGWTWAESRCQE